MTAAVVTLRVVDSLLCSVTVWAAEVVVGAWPLKSSRGGVNVTPVVITKDLITVCDGTNT